LLGDEEQRIASRIKRTGNVVVWNENQITRNKKNKQMTSEYLQKVFSYTYTKRAVQEVKEGANEIKTLPYGY
jgi:hypothetical protein